MEEVWRLGEATVRDVREALNERLGEPRAYTTVMTVMMRLVDKGVLRRSRRGRSDVYSAELSRQDWMRARAATDIDGFLDDFGDVALAHFARHIEGLDSDRRERLRRLVEEHD